MKLLEPDRLENADGVIRLSDFLFWFSFQVGGTESE